MHPFVFHFADGTFFFVGMGLVLLAMGVALRFRRKHVKRGMTLVAVLGAVLVVISATPLPFWLYLIWGTTVVIVLLMDARSRSRLRSRVMAYALFVAVTSFMVGLEINYRIPPGIRVEQSTVVYVLGDSISAGMGTSHRCWPVVLDDMSPLRVINLAQAGATVATARKQAEGIDVPGSLVIVEIGGNDLLGKTEAQDFHRQLDELLAKLAADQHRLLMVELPLFPFQNAYGRAQRQLAAKYGASLLPKRFFTRVLGAENATLDGLHLSQEGHDAMAVTMSEVIRVK